MELLDIATREITLMFFLGEMRKCKQWEGNVVQVVVKVGERCTLTAAQRLAWLCPPLGLHRDVSTDCIHPPSLSSIEPLLEFITSCVGFVSYFFHVIA